jgi:hypothetical protein
MGRRVAAFLVTLDPMQVVLAQLAIPFLSPSPSQVPYTQRNGRLGIYKVQVIQGVLGGEGGASANCCVLGCNLAGDSWQRTLFQEYQCKHNDGCQHREVGEALSGTQQAGRAGR